MLIEMDEVLVNKSDWESAKAGDAEARERIKKAIDGLEIYMHAISDQGEEVVTLRQLEALNLVGSVTLHRAPY